MVKSPAANAGDTGLRSDLWSGKIPHSVEHLISPSTTIIEPVFQSPGSATTESMCGNYRNPCTLEPVLHKRSHRNEKPAHHN